MIASLAEVRRLNKKGNVIPIFVKLPADLDTPVGAYLKLTRKKKESFLLESIEGGEKLARYSFIGTDPFLTVSGSKKQVVLTKGNKQRTIQVGPDDFMRELFSIYKPVAVADLPRFTGGAVGYFAYDTIRWVERIPDTNPDDMGLPESRFSLFKTIVVFDHLTQEIIVIVNILHDKSETGLTEKYTAAIKELKDIQQVLQSSVPKIEPERIKKTVITADYSQSDYVKMVNRAKRYIKEGDIFQVVLSQRWQIRSERSSLSVYRNLRRLNPSPYMFHISFGDTAIIGSSPEMLVRGLDPGVKPKAKTTNKSSLCWLIRKNWPSIRCFWIWGATISAGLPDPVPFG